MKNKLLKTMLPLATIASVAAPVACLTSCGNKYIEGPKSKMVVGNTTYDVSTKTYMSTCTVGDFTCVDENLEPMELRATAKFEDIPLIQGTIKPLISNRTKMFRIEFQFEVKAEAGNYPMELTIQEKEDKDPTIYYKDTFTVYLAKDIVVPTNGSGTTIEPKVTEFDLPGFFLLGADQPTYYIPTVIPRDSSWPNITSASFKPDTSTGDVDDDYTLHVSFESEPKWQNWDAKTFNIKVRLNQEIIFEDDSMIYSVVRIPPK